jgi:hypothetical protein
MEGAGALPTFAPGARVQLSWGAGNELRLLGMGAAGSTPLTTHRWCAARALAGAAAAAAAQR